MKSLIPNEETRADSKNKNTKPLDSLVFFASLARFTASALSSQTEAD
ncbi:MAG: hypothetical protein WCQ57_04550 [Verrucomicrobiota bacterium]